MSRASRASHSRWSGCATSISASARRATVRPLRVATPYSVTTFSIAFLCVVTGLPGVSVGRIRLNPLDVCEWVTMNPWPPSEKPQPRAKSAWPPAPDQ